ncbi:MAG: hypothetical protein JNJ60_07470, partial [Rhodocyclaceae bacterium]|nr:hypothetical protein [Rhodocyclaceae bacterium]
ARDVQTRIGRIADPVLRLHVAIWAPQGRLGDETFRLVSFEGQESLSEPFEFKLELHGNTELRGPAPIALRSLLGRPVSVGIALPGAAPDAFARALAGGEAGDLALWNGIVAAFAMDQPGVYRLTMRPDLWRTSLTNAYRQFANKTIREAISEVLQPYGIAHRFADAPDPMLDISASRVQDWFQCGESDLDLLRRLMAKAHLFYFIEHHADRHEIVFTAGDAAYSEVYADRRALRYAWTGMEELGLEQEDAVLQYSYQETLTSSHVVGTYVRQQAVWEVDGVAPFQPHAATRGTGELPFNQYKVYQYGLSGEQADGLAEITRQALDASRRRLSGASRSALFAPGKLFRVAGPACIDHRREMLQADLEHSVYVLTMVRHQASLDGTYQNEFQAIPKAPYAGFSLGDTQQGGILATVLDGEPQDWRYYPRDVFAPQSNSEDDSRAQPRRLQAKGVRVRIATGAEIWARLPVHSATAPEVGATVMVSRANDESELPEISPLSADGSLTVTPTGWTAHSSVGNSYSTSWGDSKSIRCGAVTPNVLDAARSKVEAAYASGQYKDASYSRGGSYSYSVSENDRSGLLSRSESRGNSYSTYAGDESKNWSDIGFSFSDSKVGTSESHSTLGTHTGTSMTGATTDASLTGAQTSTSAVGTQTSASAVGVQTGVNVTGMQNSASVTGMSNSAGVVGMSNSASLTGLSNGMDITGSSNRLSVTGSSSHLGLTGSSTGLSLTGTSQNLSLSGSSTELSIVGNSTSLGVRGTTTAISVNGPTTAIDVKAGTLLKVDIEALGPHLQISLDGSVILNIDPAKIEIHVAGVDIQIDSGIELHL